MDLAHGPARVAPLGARCGGGGARRSRRRRRRRARDARASPSGTRKRRNAGTGTSGSPTCALHPANEGGGAGKKTHRPPGKAARETSRPGRGRTVRARHRPLGRSTGRRQEPRLEPAASRARRAGGCPYHRDTKLDIPGTCPARPGQGRRGGQDPAPLPMSARASLAAPLVAIFAVGLPACSSAPLRELIQPSKGAATLATGVRQYDDGEYPEAARNIQAAIDLGLSDRDSARAHKNLAFIHCASARERACREEFSKALSIDPGLQLTPAEAGHPVWGPIFASLKASPAPFRLALQQYEAGDYAEAAKNFHGAIKGGLDDKQLASAHKHLAFIHCAANRQKPCRDEFRKALAADPTLELEPAEAGHPVWGPIFKSVKAGG